MANRPSSVVAVVDMVKPAGNLADRFEKRSKGGNEPLSKEDYADLAIVPRWLSQSHAAV